MRCMNPGARRPRFAAAVTLLAACASASVRAEAPSAIAIKDAHVVTVTGADLSQATVLLRDGLIQDVGVNLQIPPDAWVIEAAGFTVYPGFIDGLSAWGLSSTPNPPVSPGANASTPATQANPAPRSHGPEDRPQTYSFLRAADLLDPSDRRLEAARAAGFTAAVTFPARGIFEGLGAMIGLAGERAREMVIAQPVGQQIVFRTAGGGARSGFPASLMGNIAYVRQLYLDLDHYKLAKQSYAANAAGNRRPEYDHALEGLAEAPRVLLPADEAQQIDRMLNFAPELKTPVVLYGLHEAYRRIDTLKQTHVPLLVSLKWPERSPDADPADVPNFRELTMRDQAPAVPGMLAKAGLKFGFYSDGIDNADGLKRAVKKAIDAGLPRADAIRALTWNVAEMYGVSDRLGSIEKGKIANLVVTNGDAFEDKTTVEYVFVDGHKFEPVKPVRAGSN
jgi:Amidohydrolase family